MGRGQYDRAAARAKREGNHFLSQDEVMDEIVRPLTTAFNQDQKRFREAQAAPQYARPGFPYENTNPLRAADESLTRAPYQPAFPYNNPPGVVMAYDIDADLLAPLTQEKFDAIMTGMLRLRDERDRLKRLCQTHGLMI